MSFLQPLPPKSSGQSPIPPPLNMLPPLGSQTHSGTTLFPPTTTPTSHPSYPNPSSAPPPGPLSSTLRFPEPQITQPSPSKPPTGLSALHFPNPNFSQTPTQTPTQAPSGSTELSEFTGFLNPPPYGFSDKLIDSSLKGGSGRKDELRRFFSFEGVPYDIRILLGVHFVVVLLLVFVLVYVVTGGRLVGNW